MSNITKYQIEMLDVEDADAFIIYYEYESNLSLVKRLILVDAGRYSDGDKVIRHLQKYYPHRPVDLAIVTHCDDDHFGGFIRILERQLQRKDTVQIKNFWINIPSAHIDMIDEYQDCNIVYTVKSDNDSTLNLIDLLSKLNINMEEVFAGDCTEENDNIPIVVLGPTREYYESLLPDFRHADKMSLIESAMPYEYSEEATKSLSTVLDDAYDDNSAHNRSSIIFIFRPNDKMKYLFMGDANRESFDNIPTELKAYAKNVDWLKVPHHGSKHNIDSDMINIIHPDVAYVSTKNIGQYLSQATVNALSKIGCKVFSTHKTRSNYRHHGFDKRTGYTPAHPVNEKQI